jgi:predicted MFS family arabinose efflux permease
VFLTRSVGLSPAAVGLGMTIAGVLGLLLATPVGHLADRLGPREVFIACLAIEGAGSAGYLVVHGFALFLPIACLTVATDHASGGVHNAPIIGLAAREERAQTLSSLRVVSHIGWALGAAGGALIIALNSRDSYLALMILNTATFLAYAMLASPPNCRASLRYDAARTGPARSSSAIGRT